MLKQDLSIMLIKEQQPYQPQDWTKLHQFLMLLLVKLLFYYFMQVFNLSNQSHQLLKFILLNFLIFFHLHFELWLLLILQYFDLHYYQSQTATLI